MLPGLDFIHGNVASVSVVSVCPKPSIRRMPVRRRKVSYTAPFSASPAVVQYSSDERSKASTSTSVMRRYIVGGQQSVVTP